MFRVARVSARSIVARGSIFGDPVASPDVGLTSSDAFVGRRVRVYVGLRLSQLPSSGTKREF